MTEKELRMKYQRDTGKYTPCWKYSKHDVRDYVNWLESEVVRLTNLKNRLIPWEPIK